MTPYWLVLVTLVAPFGERGAFAQAISLPQALQQAQANRLEVTNQQLQIGITTSDEARRRARWQPQVNAGADFRWNTQIQRNIIRDAPFANGGDLTLQFGTPVTNVLNVQAEQKLYDAQSRLERSINRLAIEGQQVALETLKADVRQQVTQAYYGAVFSREKRRLSDQARDRARGYLEQAQTRLTAGTLLQTEFDRFALDLSNAELACRNDGREYALSLETLRYRMNSTQAVEPADSLTALLPADPQAEQVSNRLELKQEALIRQVNELNQRREQARLAPVVTAYGAYIAQQFADTFNPFQGGTWFPYNYVGVRVSVPILDGRQTRLNGQDYGRRAQISQNTARQLQADFDYEQQSARSAVVQARETLAETRKNIVQAQQILSVDRVRFDAGTMLLADFRASEYSLQQAETNYLRAVYDLLLGQLALRKATGDL